MAAGYAAGMAVPHGPAHPTRDGDDAGGAQTTGHWQLRLLGAVEARCGTRVVQRWPSRAVAGLLARLALAHDRAHSREELVELLWPGVALDVGRNRLRQALSTLRSLLEDETAAPLIIADRLTLRLAPGVLTCDACMFERHVHAGRLQAASELWRGELMPGFYDEWVVLERQRLANVADRLESVSKMLPPTQPEVSTLPNYWTRSFGSELAASRLRALLANHRLLTVHGPGGSGKTRLAVEVAQALRNESSTFVDPLPAGTLQPAVRWSRVCFVSLIDCVDAQPMLELLGTALQFDGRASVQQLAAVLAGGRALLVLDNVEQLSAAATQQIAALLASAPQLHVLATSRRLLEIDGERAFELHGLPLPDPDAPLDEAAMNPAVALLVDRTRAVKADFSLDARHRPGVLAIVRQLVGMPLAIELAASRLRSLAPSELAQRLQSDPGSPSLDLLARGATRASPSARHASMRHVVQWSWGQLTADQQGALAQLSVCVAPVRAEAAAAIVGRGGAAMQRLLDELGDASLLRSAEGADGVTRFAMLQPVREFAAEQLDAGSAQRSRGRLRGWLLGFVGDALSRGLAAVSAEAAHLHAVLVTAAADGDAEQGLALALALRSYWDAEGLPATTLRALEEAAALCTEPGLRADALELLVYGWVNAGDSDRAVAHAETARALALDHRRRSVALSRWVWALYSAGRMDAPFDSTLDEAQQLAERSGDLTAQALQWRVRAMIVSNLHLDYAQAEQIAARAQALWERLGNRPMANLMLLSRVTMWAWLGRNEEALEALVEVERTLEASGDWSGLTTALRQKGRILVRLRRGPEAAAAFRCSLAKAREFGLMRNAANAMLNLPEALIDGDEAENAARLHGFVAAYWTHLYGAINPIETREQVRARRRLRRRLGASRLEALRLQGSGMSWADAVRLALG